MAAAISWAACGVDRSAYQVEKVEDDVAEVVDLDSGRAATVVRWRLPPGVKEGDVVVDGHIDGPLTAELRREVEALHVRYAVPVPAGFSLGDDPQESLTDGEE